MRASIYPDELADLPRDLQALIMRIPGASKEAVRVALSDNVHGLFYPIYPESRALIDPPSMSTGGWCAGAETVERIRKVIWEYYKKHSFMP